MNFVLVAGADLKSGTFYNGTWGSDVLANRVDSNQVNLGDSTDNEWYVTGIQLEIGDVATPFEHEDFGTTLAKCQRYFYKRYVDTADQYLCDAFTTSGTEIVALVQTPVEMRAVPTMAGETLENASFRYDSGTGALDSFSGTAGTANTYGGSMFITTSGLAGGKSGYLRYHTSPGCGLTFDSEL